MDKRERNNTWNENERNFEIKKKTPKQARILCVIQQGLNAFDNNDNNKFLSNFASIWNETMDKYTIKIPNSNILKYF